RRHIADPEVPIANESSALPVRRRHVPARRASATTTAAAAARRTALGFSRAARRQIARGFRSRRGIDEEDLGTLLGGNAVPETIVGQPVRPGAGVRYERRRGIAH